MCSSTHALLATLLLSGCTGPRTLTIVEGALEPRHFHFVTIVEPSEEEAGGWRAACLRLPIRSDTGDQILCKMGIDMPIKTKQEGMISLPLAQRIAANCGNSAAQLSLSATSGDTPMGIACQTFKSSFHFTLNAAVEGSRVKTACHAKTDTLKPGR